MIYKVLTLNEWQSAKESGTIVTEIDQNDGFVHLSTSSQLSATLSLYFKAPSEVMLLQINFNKVEKMLKLEATSPNSSRKRSFYHLYGELLIEHVSKYWLLDRGAFNVPDEILVQAEAVDSKIF